MQLLVTLDDAKSHPGCVALSGRLLWCLSKAKKQLGRAEACFTTNRPLRSTSKVSFFHGEHNVPDVAPVIVHNSNAAMMEHIRLRCKQHLAPPEQAARADDDASDGGK